MSSRISSVRISKHSTSVIALTDAERADLLRLDRDALVARGAHPYLVFMAGLRLRMLKEPSKMEYF